MIPEMTTDILYFGTVVLCFATDWSPAGFGVHVGAIAAGILFRA